MNKEYRSIQLTVENEIAVLSFNRPAQLNAMNREMMDEIIDAIAFANQSQSIRVGIIRGNGRAFMAGADIKEYGIQTPDEFKSFQVRGKLLYDSIEQSSKPWIAAVNGFALGGGFEIALACDMILASELAVMGLPEVFLSLIPGGGGTQRLVQKIGINRVKEVLFTGNQFGANTFYDWGVINRVFESAIFENEVLQFAEKLARRPAKSLAQLKRLANMSLSADPFDQRIADEGQTVYQLFFDAEAQMAIQNFIVKNKYS